MSIKSIDLRLDRSHPMQETRYVRATDLGRHCLDAAERLRWGSKSIADQPPEEWTLVTVDLFKDFGTRNLHGIALTTFNGRAGYFDHIYFGRTVTDLDLINANGPAVRRPLSPEDLDRAWESLGSRDASKAYAAYWSLVGDPARSKPFLQQKVAAGGGVNMTEIATWIDQLDDEDWRIRDRATERLKGRLAIARAKLVDAMQQDPSPEARLRIAGLLSISEQKGAAPDPGALATQALELINRRNSEPKENPE